MALRQKKTKKQDVFVKQEHVPGPSSIFFKVGHRSMPRPRSLVKRNLHATVLALREVWESETPKNCPGISKNQCQEVWDSQLFRIFSRLKTKIQNEFMCYLA